VYLVTKCIIIRYLLIVDHGGSGRSHALPMPKCLIFCLLLLFEVILGFREDDLVNYFVYFRFHIGDILLLNVFNRGTSHSARDICWGSS